MLRVASIAQTNHRFPMVIPSENIDLYSNTTLLTSFYNFFGCTIQNFSYQMVVRSWNLVHTAMHPFHSSLPKFHNFTTWFSAAISCLPIIWLVYLMALICCKSITGKLLKSMMPLMNFRHSTGETIRISKRRHAANEFIRKCSGAVWR